MVLNASLLLELTHAMHRSLLPPRFPVRRDIEVESACTDPQEFVCFYDHVWLEAQVFAAAAIRLHGAGMEGAWNTAGLRQSLRALLHHEDDPETVIGLLGAIAPSVRTDIALMRLDLVSGAISLATSGQAQIRRAGSQEPLAAGTISPGDVIWLTAGEATALSSRDIPVEGLEALVRPALSSGTANVGCAIHYKAAPKSKRSTTFIVTNDLTGVPPLLEDLNRFFLRQALDDEDVAGLDVALDELITNAINYGYHDGNAHEILIEVNVEGDCLSIDIRDDGAPFDPLKIPEPDLSVELEERQVGGLGMHFVRSLLDKVEYRRSNGWNVVSLEKRLRHGAGSEE